VAYYAKNREQEIRRVRIRQDATVRFLRELRDRPCADCGGLFEPHQMDFDHRDPSAKLFKITTGRAMLMSKQRLVDEIAKCDVVCANCHRIRSWKAQRARLSGALPTTRRQHSLQRRYQAHLAVLNRLRSGPCEDCGGRFPACAMDFDHRPGQTKVKAVSRMASSKLERLLAEAAKCDIVCANCHRLRTYSRRAN
jgi:hypothetical protein